MDLLKVEIIEEGKRANSKPDLVYHISKLNIETNARRIGLMTPFMEDPDVSDIVKVARMNACNLIATLHDEQMNLMFPNDETAMDEFLSSIGQEMDLFNILMEEYNDLNPPDKKLKAKKKKSLVRRPSS